MDASVEIDVLKLRLELLEEIALRTWISELKTTDAQNRSEAESLAITRLGEYAEAVKHKTPVAKGALAVFADHVEALKSSVGT